MNLELPPLNRAFLAGCYMAIAGALSSGCAAPPRPTSAPPALASKLRPDWVASADKIRSGERSIYFRGRASNAHMIPKRNWSGTIRGEVLILDPRMAVVIPAGVFALRPDGSVNITGLHTIITDQPGVWKHLLLP